MLSLVEITAFRLESKSCKGFFLNNFPPMRALEFIIGHMIYNPAYTYKFQLKTTQGEIEVCYPCTTDLIIIFTAIIQFGLQIWASVVVLGSVSNWQSTNKSSDYFCEKTPFISLIVIWIIEWVWLGIMVFKLYRKYTNSRKSGSVVYDPNFDPNNVQIALIENTNRSHTYFGNENVN